MDPNIPTPQPQEVPPIEPNSKFKLLKRETSGLGMLYNSEANESMRCVVHRHPFGIVIIYIGTLIAVLAAMGLIFFLVPSVVGNQNTSISVVIDGLTAFAVIIISLLLLVQTFVYRQNKLLVTNKNVVQILQRGLFSRKVSQLSMASVEDVNADQRGVFATILNFGTLTVQTAGEQENFIFIYCPNPNFFAQEILKAREQFIDENNGNG